MKASSTAPAASSSAMTQVSSVAPVASSSVMTKGGKTYTTYQTTMVTITSCPEACTTTVAPSTKGGNSMAESAYGSAGVWSSKESAPMSKPATTGTVGTATTPAAPSGSGCPANLDGEYQYPHLIVPVSSENKDKAYGTSYNGTISPSVSSIFNFDLPQSYE